MSLDDIELSDDGGMAVVLQETPLDILQNLLSQRDIDLLCAYYEAEHGTRHEVAARFGMDIGKLYDEIERIRKLVRSSPRITELMHGIHKSNPIKPEPGKGAGI